MPYVIAAALLYLFFIYKPFDECRDYSSYNCKQIEEADYNVYFYFPNGNESYLGQAKGLDSCGDLAHSQANQYNNPQGWSYVTDKIDEAESEAFDYAAVLLKGMKEKLGK